MAGCVNLAIQYRFGFVVPVDRKKERELLDFACENGNLTACLMVVPYHVDEAESEIDWDRTNDTYERGCEEANDHMTLRANACFELGLSYSLGRGLEIDEKKAMHYFVSSCQLGYPPACEK